MDPWQIKTYDALVAYLDDLPPGTNTSIAAAEVFEAKTRLPPLPDMILEWSYSCVFLSILWGPSRTAFTN